MDAANSGVIERLGLPTSSRPPDTISTVASFRARIAGWVETVAAHDQAEPRSPGLGGECRARGPAVVARFVQNAADWREVIEQPHYALLSQLLDHASSMCGIASASPALYSSSGSASPRRNRCG